MLRNLRETQLAMLEVLSSPEGVEAALWDLGGFEALVESDARLGAVGRMGIYADMYAARLRSALAATYPQVARLLGDEAFAALARAYFAAVPSRAPSLRDCGASFADFLAGRRAGWIVDLARLEWARHDVFDAADEPILDLGAVQVGGADRLADLPLRLVRAHRFVAAGHEVTAAWRTLADGGEPGVPPRRPNTLLVWRSGVAVYHRCPEPEEVIALGAAAEGLRFGELCEALDGHDAPQRAAGLLVRWLADELLVAPPGA